MSNTPSHDRLSSDAPSADFSLSDALSGAPITGLTSDGALLDWLSDEGLLDWVTFEPVPDRSV